MKKLFKQGLGLVLAVVMVLGLIPGTTNLKAYATKEMPLSNGYIYFQSVVSKMDFDFVYDAEGKHVPSKMKGISYDKSTNTLTLNNVSKALYELKIQGMGDLTINLKGNNKLKDLDCGYTSVSARVTVTFAGNGKLTMNSKYQGEQVHGFILVCGPDAKLTIGKNVSMDINGTSSNPPLQIYRRLETKGAQSKYLSISGSHSSGSLKWNSSYQQYEWNKTTFTKTGGGSSSGGSSSSKTAVKPAQVKNPKASSASKKVTLTWTKLSKNCTGYQAQLSTNKNFKNAKTKKLTSKNKNKATWSSLKAGKTVYLRVRAYNTKNKKTKYGSWSKTVKIKVKSGSSKKSGTSKSSVPNVTGIKATSPQSGYADFTWTKLTKNCAGYQAQLSYDSKFATTYDYNLPSPNYYNVYWYGLTSGKYVYFRIRAYDTKNGKKVYGAWSSAKKVKVK